MKQKGWEPLCKAIIKVRPVPQTSNLQVISSPSFPLCLPLSKHLFPTSLSSFPLCPLVLQRLWRGCGRSTTRPSSRWSRPISTTSWGSTRSQVSQMLRLRLRFVLMCGFFCLGCFGDWFVDLFVHTHHPHIINQHVTERSHSFFQFLGIFCMSQTHCNMKVWAMLHF